MENLIEVNPFTNEFVKGEIEFMQYDMSDRLVEYRGLTMKFAEISGRCDDYLNKNFRVDDWKTPIMFIDGTLWMSLSSMEVTSSFFGWWGMSGDVAMLGLGTGYTTLKCAANDAVESVTVYEIDQRVIDFFYFMHGTKHAKLLEKVKFVVGDVRETFRGKSYDGVFADFYQCLGEDEAIDDIDLFHKHNDIGWYRFWGQELFQLIALNEEIIPTYALSMIDLDYLRRWQETDESNMYGPHIDVGYAHRAVHTIGQYPETMYLDVETFNEEYEEENYG